MITPPPVSPGGRVAVVSPSFGGPGVFPVVHERGVAALREQFGLEVVEMPTTREVDASPRDRARDLTAAFADASIEAILASIGGEDQITVLPYLDADVIRANPKRFYGYSDNTNVLNYLWNLGLVSYHGGSTLVHLARAGGLHPETVASLRRALFTRDLVEVTPTTAFSDLSPQWHDLATLDEPTETTPEPGWYWSDDTATTTGDTWGGNLEILHWNLATGRWIQPVEAYAGCVLILETSEEMPSALEVFRMLRNMGERGLLEQFPAVVVAKAKAWNHDTPLDAPARRAFRDDQRDAVLTALARYNPHATVVMGPDFGHTDPQVIIPFGGEMTVDAATQRIFVQY